MPQECNFKTDFHEGRHHFVQTGTAKGAPPIIKRSWQRNRRQGLDPFLELPTLKAFGASMNRSTRFNS